MEQRKGSCYFVQYCTGVHSSNPWAPPTIEKDHATPDPWDGRFPVFAIIDLAVAPSANILGRAPVMVRHVVGRGVIGPVTRIGRSDSAASLPGGGGRGSFRSSLRSRHFEPGFFPRCVCSLLRAMIRRPKCRVFPLSVIIYAASPKRI
jgi:hypothetical protein